MVKQCHKPPIWEWFMLFIPPYRPIINHPFLVIWGMAYRCSSPPEGALWLEPVLSRRSAPLCGASALRRAVPWEEMLAGEMLRLGALGRCLKLGSCLPLMWLKLFFPSKNNLNHLNIYLFYYYIYISKTYFKPNMAFTVLRAKGCIIFLLQG